ncbi:MAG: glycosyltransferase [Chloroflexi bacterium]|nr:glycosyltransferase [Chloroflexota bacterium]
MISIVIPAFNEETFIPRCLESLQNQDYDGDYEIIVVDNGSADDTSKVASKFGVRVVHCPKRGVVYARQMGASLAKGDIIAQADADTIYPEDWLSRIAKHFVSHPWSVALGGSFIYRKEEEPSWAGFEYFGRYLINKIGQLLFGRMVYVSGANFAFRREAFLKANGYDPTSLYPDQWGISRNISRVGKVSYDKTLLVFTSARRIQKSFLFVFGDVVLNATRIFAHFIEHDIRLFKGLPMRVPMVRTPAKLAALTSMGIIVGVLSYGYIAPGSQVFGKVYYAGKTTDKVVALTFDDGPNEPYTSQILDILKNYGVKATFFAIGKNVELYPETAKRIIAEGHVVGNHTYSHNANHALVDSHHEDLDIELAQEAILKVTGVKPHLYRPPHGKKSPWELHYLKDQKMIEVTWSVAANDQHVIAYFGKPSAEMFAKEIIDKARPGKIILLHDGYGTSHSDTESDKSLTVKVLPSIIEGLQKRGYRFVTVPELLNMPAYN